jgi:hypothetical protein
MRGGNVAQWYEGRCYACRSVGQKPNNSLLYVEQHRLNRILQTPFVN